MFYYLSLHLPQLDATKRRRVRAPRGYSDAVGKNTYTYGKETGIDQGQTQNDGAGVTRCVCAATNEQHFALPTT